MRRRVLSHTYLGFLLAVVPGAQAYAAFDDAAFEVGAGQSGAALRFALAAIIATLAFLWASWLAVGAYRGWADGSLDAGAAMLTVLRGLLVLAVIGMFVR